MIHWIRNTIIIACGLLFLTSCHEILFQEPQPVDMKDEVKIPRKFRGTWVTKGDSIIIDKRRFINIEYDEVELPLTGKDSLRHYSIRNGYLYTKEGDEVSVGLIIAQSDSIITVHVRKTNEVRLGNDNVLRRAGDDYILSTRNDDDDQWWQLSLITRSENKDVLIKTISDDDLDLINRDNVVFEEENDTYLDCQWTEKQLINLIDKGLFSDTVTVLERENKIK